MEEVCAEADRMSVYLVLEFAPYTGTDPERLRKLYSEHGFRDRMGVMVRRSR